ncbi:hypothetical protein QUB75_29930 [Microcoleus sp. K1-B6]
MKWLTDDEFFATKVGAGVNSAEEGDSLRDSYARAYFEYDRGDRAEFPQ